VALGSCPSVSAAFARGYFDAEGGVPRDPSSRFYVQLCQKNYSDLKELRERIRSLGIATGILHNPSRRVDPAYWRFYIRAGSWGEFITQVGSWHPAKRPLLDLRLLQGSEST
jgi:hypothetical protein